MTDKKNVSKFSSKYKDRIQSIQESDFRRERNRAEQEQQTKNKNRNRNKKH